jgi:hypothetical protein
MLSSDKRQEVSAKCCEVCTVSNNTHIERHPVEHLGPSALVLSLTLLFFLRFYKFFTKSSRGCPLSSGIRVQPAGRELTGFAWSKRLCGVWNQIMVDSRKWFRRSVRRQWPAGRFGPRAGGMFLLLLVFVAAIPAGAREKEKLSYGEGLIVNIPLPESEVRQVVEDVAQNGVIRGTKEYNKDEFVAGAKAAASCRVFPAWNEDGKVFYKVREQALDPRNFKDTNDVGTLAVRYVVQAQGEKNTVLRIDALFEEDFRHTVHKSNGSVESSEYKDIQEHLEAIEVMKNQNVEAEKERQEQLAKKHKPATPTYAPTETAEQSVAQAFPHATAVQVDPGSQTAAEQPQGEVLSNQTAAIPTPPGQTLEEHVKDLRKQVERLVKAPGAPLKSAPFHTASTLQTLSSGTEILILISTPYWYGVETHDGQHGWIMRDQLEQP